MVDDATAVEGWWELRLSRHVNGGTDERRADRLWEELGAVAVAEGRGELVATFAGRAAAEAARTEMGGGEVRPAPAEGEWRDVWRAWATPTVAGRLLVRPAWLPPCPEAEADRVVVVLEPGAAWGHGGHPSTRLVLEVLSERLRGGESVLDVGCGSGALTLGALALGARHVTASDIDPAALAATRDNAARNGLVPSESAASRLRTTLSPVASLWSPVTPSRSSVAPPLSPVAAIRRRFDVVVANIGAAVLMELADALASRVVVDGGGAAPGLLVLSGLLEAQWPQVVERFEAAGGLRLVDVRHEDGWSAPVLTGVPTAPREPGH